MQKAEKFKAYATGIATVIGMILGTIALAVAIGLMLSHIASLVIG